MVSPGFPRRLARFSPNMLTSRKHRVGRVQIGLRRGAHAENLREFRRKFMKFPGNWRSWPETGEKVAEKAPPERKSAEKSAPEKKNNGTPSSGRGGRWSPDGAGEGKEGESPSGTGKRPRWNLYTPIPGGYGEL